MRRGSGTGLLAPAGLVVGPALWAATTQAGQVLPYLSCGSPWRPAALATFPAALASLAAAGVSWRASGQQPSPAGETSSYPGSYAFVGRVSALAGIVFAYALALQGLSALVLTACER